MIEAPEAPHVHHKHEPNDRKRLTDIAIPLAVILVSLGSLYVSLHTGETMEKLVEQNSRLVRANSVPLLQFDTGNVGDDTKSPEIYLAVRNVGTGPARIVWFEILHEGKPLHDWTELLPKNSRLDVRRLGTITSTIALTMMPAGDRRKLMAWRPSAAVGPGQSDWQEVDRARQKLKVEACYCSLFDECWLTNAEADVPKPVARCEVGERISYRG